MKKIMILAVALLSMTTTFAAEEATNATAAYNMNIKMGSLADALSLNIDQVDAVSTCSQELHSRHDECCFSI